MDAIPVTTKNEAAERCDWIEAGQPYPNECGRLLPCSRHNTDREGHPFGFTINKAVADRQEEPATEAPLLDAATRLVAAHDRWSKTLEADERDTLKEVSAEYESALSDVRVAVEREARRGEQPAPLDVERLNTGRLQHAWMILTALHLPDDQRWEPDRYNCAAFLKAWMAKYARLNQPSTEPIQAGTEHLTDEEERYDQQS